MLEYTLVENHLAGQENEERFVAHTKSIGTKTLEDVIKCLIAEGTGLTRPQALAYFEKISQSVVQFLSDGYCVSTPLFIARPTIKGIFADGNDNFDPLKHSIQIRIRPGSRLRNLPLEMFIAKRERKEELPVLINFIDASTKAKNTIMTPNGIGKIVGKKLQFDDSDLAQGVFFAHVDNPEIHIRSLVHSDIYPSEINFSIPDLAPGEYHVIVKSACKTSNKIGSGYMKKTIIV
jgi:hypothetical protein